MLHAALAEREARLRADTEASRQQLAAAQVRSVLIHALRGRLMSLRSSLSLTITREWRRSNVRLRDADARGVSLLSTRSPESTWNSHLCRHRLPRTRHGRPLPRSWGRASGWLRRQRRTSQPARRSWRPTGQSWMLRSEQKLGAHCLTSMHLRHHSLLAAPTKHHWSAGGSGLAAASPPQSTWQLDLVAAPRRKAEREAAALKERQQEAEEAAVIRRRQLDDASRDVSAKVCDCMASRTSRSSTSAGGRAGCLNW